MGFAPLKAALVSAAFLFGTAGCAVLSSPDTPGNLQDILGKAREHGFVQQSIQAGAFRLAGYVRHSDTPADIFTLYIEGDGAPWPTPFSPPNDPTPLRPTALEMALADPGAAVAYMARPCQYLTADALRQCDSAWWTERRFAPEVVAAYDEVVDQLKSKFLARHIRLVGYSGGGVMAVLLAAQRKDIESVLTVAAPLSVGEWVAWHGASSLMESLDPALLGTDTHLPPSVHFVGGNDKTVPVPVVESFVRHMGGWVVIVPGFDHECCWARDWAKLLEHPKVREGL
ncbi:MAG TPA: hypothetical protein PLI90_07905 [Rhodocyclaceae bacterium]|nr:hypothetical protein [Rhodocyclaceae bacterium]